MQSAQRLSVHVATWNSARYLPNLFLSLDAQTFRDFTVTVVDNASVDGTAAWLTEHRPDVATLKNARNKGFARAHNQAIALALSRWEGASLAERYVFVVNPDVEFAPETFERLVAFMDAHPEVAACCPKLHRAVLRADSGDGDVCDVERTDIIDAMGIGIAKSRRMFDRGAGERDTGQYDEHTDVFGPSGCCALYRASALVAVKLGEEWFDEQFFAYQEDVDLAWRMRLHGFETRLVPGAVAWHHRLAKSLQKPGWFQAWIERMQKPAVVNFLSTRNHSWVLLKNDHFVNLLIHAPWWISYECAKVLASITSWAQFRGQLSSLVGFPAMLRKRHAVFQRAKADAAAMRRWFQ